MPQLRMISSLLVLLVALPADAQTNPLPLLQRIANRDSLAHRAAKKFLRGVNLGNYLEAPPTQNWGATYSRADFVQIRAEGFDHVRLPIAWHHYTGPGPDFKLSDQIFA